MSTHTITLPTDDELTPEIRQKLATIPPLNVFRMMARTPNSFHSLLDFATSILMGTQFDTRRREITALRVAKMTHSNYESVQSVNLAMRAGVTDDEISQIDQDGPVTWLDEEGNLLCRVAD